VSVVAFVTLTLLAGCLPDYFPRRNLGGVSESEVVGKWKLTQSYPPAAWSEDAGAEFFGGGHCTLHKFADGDDEISGDYTWQVDVEADSKASVLHITGFGTPQHPLRISFHFTRKHGKLVLWDYVGDPDGRHYIEYERI
jgi:hypothetical protein